MGTIDTTATKNRATDRRQPTSARSPAVSAPGPLLLQVAEDTRTASTIVCIDRLQRALRARLYPAERDEIERRINTSKHNLAQLSAVTGPVPLYFTCQGVVSWVALGQALAAEPLNSYQPGRGVYRSRLIERIAVTHALALKAERERQEQKRREDAERPERERRATENRLAYERDQLAYEREQAKFLALIEEAKKRIAGDVYRWRRGTLYVSYASGKFSTFGHPIELHDGTGVSRLHIQALAWVIEQWLRRAYASPGKILKVFPANVDLVELGNVAVRNLPYARVAIEQPDVSDETLMMTNPAAYLERLQQHRLGAAREMHEKVVSIAETGATILEAINPLDPTNLAVMGATVVGGPLIAATGRIAAPAVIATSKVLRRAYKVRVVKAVKALRRLEAKGLESRRLSDWFMSSDFGRYQISKAGGRKTEFLGTLSSGRKVQIDNVADSVTAAGKVDIIEMKFGNPYFDVVEKSRHLPYWESKADQMTRLARYAHENQDEVDRVIVVCSNQAVGETYLNIIHQQVPAYLRKYLDVLEEA